MLKSYLKVMKALADATGSRSSNAQVGNVRLRIAAALNLAQPSVSNTADPGGSGMVKRRKDGPWVNYRLPAI